MAFSIKESIGEMGNDKELAANIKNVSQGLPSTEAATCEQDHSVVFLYKSITTVL